MHRPTSVTPCGPSVCARSEDTFRTSPRTLSTPTRHSGSNVLWYASLLFLQVALYINLYQDDSAIRRISVPELYLSADACLILLSE